MIFYFVYKYNLLMQVTWRHFDHQLVSVPTSWLKGIKLMT